MSEKKRIPEIRFNGFESEWEEKRFDEISTISQGLQISIEKRFLEDGENRSFYITNEFLKPNSNIKYYIENPNINTSCDVDDILMTRTGNTGEVVTDVKGVFHNNFFKIDYNKNLINKKFLYNLLKLENIQNEILIRASGSTILDLKHNDFYGIKSYYTGLKEQKQIGNFIDLLEKTITGLNREISNLQSYKQTMLQKMFPMEGEKVPEMRFEGFEGEWEKKKIGELYNFITAKSKNDVLEDNGEYFVMDMGAISSEGINIATKKTNCSDDILKTNDLIMPKDDIGGGLIIGRTAIIKEDNKYVLGDHVYLLSNKSNVIDNLFVHYSINSEIFRKKVKRIITGSAQLGINSSNYSKLKLLLPSFVEQKFIGQFLNSVDNQIYLQQQKLETYKNLKKTLLKKMFI